MPEVKDEEVGRRLFQIHKEKAVEIAIEKMRRKMPSEWTSFASSDIDILKHMLGEVWVCITRAEWEAISFTKLTKKDLLDIIHTAKQVISKEKAEKIAIDEICDTLISKE